jgi:hypothetical protein
VLKDAKKAV